MRAISYVAVVRTVAAESPWGRRGRSGFIAPQEASLVRPTVADDGAASRARTRRRDRADPRQQRRAEISSANGSPLSLNPPATTTAGTPIIFAQLVAE